ncbi:MAG: UPF0149 family protein [Sandaracinaceae bacterium]
MSLARFGYLGQVPRMHHHPDLSERIDDDEWDELEALFAASGGPNMETICGLLNAVATAPSTIPPSAWLPLALGEREGIGSESPLLVRLLRLYNMVVDQLAHDAPLCPSPDDTEGIRHWCEGYALGVNLDDDWRLDIESMAWATPIIMITDGVGPSERVGDDLDARVLDAYHGLAAARVSAATASGGPRTVRREPKVGRNEPCPCGSGKKHKKCCLRASN